jgi:hypothetical protein
MSFFKNDNFNGWGRGEDPFPAGVGVGAVLGGPAQLPCLGRIHGTVGDELSG